MEGKHEQEVTTQGWVLGLAVLDHIPHGEARVVIAIVRQFTATFDRKCEGFRALGYQGRNELCYLFNHAKQAALHVLEVVSQKFINILVQIQLDGNDEPNRIHLEQQEVSEKRLASDHDLRIFNQLREGSVEYSLFLQRFIKLLVWLGKGNIEHRDECLLDTRCTLMQSQCEVAARKRGEYGREQRRVELADVRYGDSGGDSEHLIAYRIVYVKQESNDVQVCK